MAIVKNNYVKRGMGEKNRVKATIRYIQHRPGRDGERLTRKLFGSDGLLERKQVYQMIDTAKKGTTFFRIVISPDPKREDTQKDLDLWAITTTTMQTLEERLKKQVQWVAVEHSDHKPHRHIHALVLVQGRLSKEDLQALRQAATAAALFQRQERDLALGHHAQRFIPPRIPRPAYGGNQGEAQTKPAKSLQTCPECGYGEAAKLSDHLCKCPFCGLVVTREPKIPIRSEEAQWAR